MLIIQLKVILDLLRKNKFLFILFSSLALFSCDGKVYRFEDVMKLSPTHSIKNKAFIHFLTNFENKRMFNEGSNTYLVYVEKNKLIDYKISIAKTDFFIFKSNVNNFEYFKYLKGYLIYKNNLILLYGNIDDVFFKKNNNQIKNIMFMEKNENTDSIIYEPIFVDYNSPLPEVSK